MEDELDFDSAAKPSRDAKRGRRAGVSKPTNPPDAPAFESPADSPQPTRSKAARDQDEGGPPPKPSRMSGWGEENPRKSRKLGEGFEFDDERLRPHSPDREDESDNDIPVIPDLEDQQEEDMSTKIAVAPNVAVNRVATYRELDHDLQKQAAFLTLDNEIDLKLLTKSLSADADLLEEDKPWDWDRLFTEVTSELFTQTEQTEENDIGDQVLP
ncbi:intraflagellar transport protein 43 homolog [Crassostrea virginica]|uniref:Intraflagellar transport protein 43 homolog A-like isoform X3 n=1 Tax=Crassostrea virginica TaxID=6565 RepID=A0A8B8DTK5_CRAVI|nr:intraflagellar transport protein 43 homolog A-like isoform X3 [Crassostrea virginica]